jgi:LuxR family maltose regulon positive regulatory protein
MHEPGALLQTKLTRPQTGAAIVPRPNLVAAMNQALKVRLTLLSAPAGFGKTTLTLEWLESQPDPDLTAVWLSLDEQDNHLLRFWCYVVGGLRHAQQLKSQYSADLVSLHGDLASNEPPPMEDALTALLNVLSAAPGPIIFVLDDYHLIHLSAVHESLHYFIMHLPAHVHVAILTRADPALPLNRLRSQNQLFELRARDLSFLATEVGALLSRRVKLTLPPEMVDALTQRTEGWPAGVHLLTLSLQGRNLNQAHHLVHSFTGSNRYVFDYLLEEVLHSQPSSIQHFLLRTSILSRLTASLCDALLEVDAAQPALAAGENAMTSQEILAFLETHNLFLVRMDEEGRWRRYYHLFAEALRNELERRAPDLIAQLHKRAAAWCAQHHLAEDALEHALQAEEWSLAASLMTPLVKSLMLKGDFARLNHWLSRLPAHIIDTHPRLAVTYACMILFRGPLPQVAHLLKAAIQALNDPAENDASEALALRSEIKAINALLASFHWDVHATLAGCLEAERFPGDDDLFSRALIAQARGRAFFYGGDLEQAMEQCTSGIAICQQLGGPFIALFPLFRLAQCHAAQGELGIALRIFRRGLHQAALHDGGRWPVSADAFIGLAQIMYEQNDLHGAEHHVRRGIDFAHQRGVESLVVGLTVQARICLALKRVNEATDALHQAVECSKEYDNQNMKGWLAAHQARLDLAIGDVDEARRWAETWNGQVENDGYLPEFEELTRVRVYLAQRRWRLALGLLRSWEHKAEAAPRQRSLIEILVLKSEALWGQGDEDGASAALQRALVLAEPEGMRRIFLDEGASLLPILKRLADLSTFAAELWEMQRIEHNQRYATEDAFSTLLDPLTPRELEILRLIARGASNQQIADAFVLTVGTVKGHVNHILGKLSAHNRTEAVAHARELGMI